jgi:hypothetical protein
MTIEGEDGIFTLAVIASEAYFENPDLVYPVILDPSVHSTSVYGSANVSDTFITSKYPDNIYYTDPKLKIGFSSDLSISRGLVKLNSTGIAPYMKNSDGTFNRVTLSAKLRVYEDYGSATTPKHNAHRITANWNETQTKWNNRPAFASTVSASVTVKPSAYNYFDLTSLFWQWVDGSVSNYGVCIKQENETQNYYKRYRSTQSPDGDATKPVFQIIYVDSMEARILQRTAVAASIHPWAISP